MNGSLFITLYDEATLKLYLHNGLYGFLMKPVLEGKPGGHSQHYSVLADYACSREGTDVFFFLKRKIVYGGKIYGNSDIGSFYLNGQTSPLGREADANLFWDESSRYTPTNKDGVFKVGEAEKAQPFIVQFHQNENTGKYIDSDNLYFELGKYPYPLPSNSMENMSFCTLTPGETDVLRDLIFDSKDFIDFDTCEHLEKKGNEYRFNENLTSINDDFCNEAQMEFTILSNLKPFESFLMDDYILCRQVPISPFKPMNMDRADICLYSINDPIKDGTIPNIVIELKKSDANFHAYEQAVRYLKWLDKITTKNEFTKIKAFVISENFKPIKRSKVDTTYESKIKMYALQSSEFIDLS